jgi:hypothetical protein
VRARSRTRLGGFAPALGLTLGALAVGVLSAGCPASLDERCGGGVCDTSPIADGGAPDVVGPPDGCDADADPKDAPKCVVDAYGVFVAPGGSGDGSKASPLGSIQQALGLAASRGVPRVYVCDGEYDERVTLERTIDLFGGFRCEDWTPSPTRPRVHPSSPGYALFVKSLRLEDGQLTVEHLDFESAPGKSPGESSVGAFVLTSADVAFRDDRIAAGAGVPASPPEAAPSNYAAGANLTGNRVSEPSSNAGAPAAINTCVAYGSSTGGAGGNGGDFDAHPDGHDGVPGTTKPEYPAGTGTGLGGPGAKTNPPGGCGVGTPGGGGAAQLGGKAATAPGAISDTGWTPGNGGDGLPGNPGQGGGGGGGTRISLGGAGGGGGGAGGCGGSGGRGGAGGGGSIALLIASSKVAIDGSELYAGDGGRGADGLEGEQGQPGGASLVDGAGTNACAGTGGGPGAGGSGGAGGAGGVSIGVAFAGSAPVVDGAPVPAHADTLGAVKKLGTPGARGGRGAAGKIAPGGGAEAKPGNEGEDGLPGIAAAVWSPP